MITISQRNGTGGLAGFVGAIVLVILAGRVGSLIDGSGLHVFYVALLLLGVIAAALPLAYARCRWYSTFVIFAGIPIGVLIDVQWDLTVNGIDRNLFPIEVVFWWLGAVIPVSLGYVFGYTTKIERNREQSSKP